MDTSLVTKLADYRPSDTAAELICKTSLLLLVGPTGAGKDSLKDILLETGTYHHIISHTTRPPRINHGILEQNGRDYHFIDLATAEVMLDQQAFVEAKIYSGNLYGTSIAEIQKAYDEHKTAMTDVDVQGVAEYKQLDPHVLALFMLPPSFEIWQERLQRRYGDVTDAADYRLRLQTGLDEIEQLLTTNYYTPLINNTIEETAVEVQAIVESPEHYASHAVAAQELAKKLAQDIKQYLDTNN